MSGLCNFDFSEGTSLSLRDDFSNIDSQYTVDRSDERMNGGGENEGVGHERNGEPSLRVRHVDRDLRR